MGSGLFTRERVLPLALGLLALLLAFLIVHDVFVPAAPTAAAINTATVSRGTIQTTVTGTGTVVPAQQQSIGFGVTGTVSEIDVKVGDHVTKGQVLARLDPTQLQQSLTQAQNGVTTAQASLNNAQNSNAVTQAQHQLANAQQNLSDTQASVNLTNQQDQNTLAADQQQLTNDKNALPGAQNALNACLQQQKTNNTVDCTQKQQAVTNLETAINTTDPNKVAQDQNKISTDQLAGQKQLDTANQQVTSAQDSLNNASSQRPNSIATSEASLSNAQLQVQTAQKNLDSATLTAPFDGTIMAINGQVGESASGGTAQAPGSTAPLGGSSGGGGGSGAAAAAASASGSGGGGGSFMTISNVATMEVVAPFAEADAARVQPNQQASVTFDAITGLTLTGHVLAVAPNATVTSNVTNYDATLVLDTIDSRLKAGMTANAAVIVQQAQNVLTVPNSVITRIGGVAFVTLLGKDGKTETRQPVQTGAVGTGTTEITSGLNEGDKVVRPSLTTGTGAGAAGGGRLGGGLGGGGLGGGGVRIGGGG